LLTYSFAVNGGRLSYITQSFPCAKPDLSIDPDVAKAVAIYLCQKMELSMTEIRAAAQIPGPAEKTSEGFGRRRFLAWSSTAWRDRLTVVRKPSHNQK
jgi:hypothetical protein